MVWYAVVCVVLLLVVCLCVCVCACVRIVCVLCVLHRVMVYGVFVCRLSILCVCVFKCLGVVAVVDCVMWCGMLSVLFCVCV